MKKALLIIDPQNDFMDKPWGAAASPALPVSGASADMDRLAHLIAVHGAEYADIYVTLDSHQVNDIAHPSWWVNPDGKNPSPYTVITKKDVKSGAWSPKDPEMMEHALFYLDRLKEQNKYELRIWPEHCLVGTPGHNVWPALQDAINNWSRQFGRNPVWVWKGLNPKTENYSALKAEVEIVDDSSTKLNNDLINKLTKYDRLDVAGEALSHCVASTIMDYLTHINDGSKKKVALLRDCTSSVTGFEAAGEDFIKRAKKLGMMVENSTSLPKLKL